MKRLISIFLCFAIIFGCASCTIDMNIRGKHNGSSSADMSKPVPPKPFVRLESFSNDGNIMSVHDMGDNKVAVISMFRESQANGINNIKDKYKLYIVDIEQDKVLAEKDIDKADTILGIRKNGEYVALDSVETELIIYDKDLNPIEIRKMQEGAYSFDKEEDCLYHEYHGTLKRINFDGNEETVVSFKKDATIDKFDIKSGLFIITGGGINDNDDIEYSVYSSKEKRILYSGYGQYSIFSLINGNILIQNSEPITGEDEEINYYETVTGYERYTGEKIYSYEVPESVIFYCFDGTEYALGINPIYDDGIIQETRLMLTNFKDGKMTELDSKFKTVLYHDVEYIGESDKFVCGMTGYEESKSSSSICVISPEVIELKDDLKQNKKEEKKETEYTLGEHLKNARKLADKYENKFSVRILLGNECMNARPNDNNGTYKIISTEDEEYSRGKDYESESLQEFLPTLLKALEKYPLSFFETFKNYRGDGGLRFLIVEDLINENGDFEAAGLHYTNNAWYNVILDYDEMYEESIHHEIWHAVESRIWNEDTYSFADDDWEKLNPKNFKYAWDFEHYDDTNENYKYILDFGYDNDDIYFVESYSTVNDREDRATLIEKLYTGRYDYNGYGHDYYDNSYDYVYSYPHLKAKLDYMAKYVKEVFGDVYWITWFSKTDE